MSSTSKTRPIYPFDWIVISYSLIVLVCILIFGRPLAQYARELFAYATIAALSAFVIRYVDEEKGRVFKILRYLYPVLLFGPMYRLTAGTIFLIFDRFYDYQIIHLEK